jgi:short-subunit dehydrogenase
LYIQQSDTDKNINAKINNAIRKKHMNSFETKGKALITGASTGIGAVYADRVAERGYDLILVARDESRLRQLAQRLSSRTGRHVEVLRADLIKKADLAQVEKVLRTDPQIRLLVNNAGFAVLKPLVESNLEELQDLIALNVTALTRLSHAVIAPFLQRKTGALINMSAAVALLTNSDMIDATYGASKAYVLNFTQRLDHELRPAGIQVQAVLPGATSSEIFQRAGRALDQLPKEIVMTPEDMVDAALVGFDRKELVTIPALPNVKDWEAFEAARIALQPNLSRAKPAERYFRVQALELVCDAADGHSS